MGTKRKRRFVLSSGYKKAISDLDFKDMSSLYDELCREADIVLQRHNPCEIDGGKCLDGRPCCNFCEFLSKRKGCVVESLACKLWLCENARKKFKACARQLDAIKKVAKKNPFIPLGERSVKEDIFCYYEIVRGKVG